MLSDEVTLEVDMFGSRKDVGGAAMEILRAGSFTALRLFGPLFCWDCGTGVALGDRGLEPFLGEPLTLRPLGTTVVTPLMLLDSEADE